MNEYNIKCTKFNRKSRKFKTFRGVVGQIAPNRINRRFDTIYPLQKLTTDITEFKCKGETKLYLNPILDMFNGEIVCYGISKNPRLELVTIPLNKCIKLISDNAKYRTTIHSDQGWHYQHNEWHNTMKKNKIYCSMSRRGNCIDNSVMENFFGLLKQEIYYGEELLNYDDLKKKIEVYIDFYNNKRIKKKLNGLSPIQYRRQNTQFTY